MGKILIIGLGSSNIDELKESTIKLIRDADEIYARTSRHGAIEGLGEEKIKFFDYLYEDIDNFQDVEEEIAKVLLHKSSQEDLLYLVPRSPYILEKAVEILIKEKDDIEIINNRSAAELVLEVTRHSSEGYKTLSAKDFKPANIDFSLDLIIQEIDNDYLLDETITSLRELYPDSTSYSLVKDGGLKSQELYKGQLGSYKRNISPNHQTSLLVYKPSEQVYGIAELVDLVDYLRGPRGIAFFIKQSHDSLKDKFLSGAYGVVDAIDKEDYEALSESLGEVFFQILINTQIAYENGDFTIKDLINYIINDLFTVIDPLNDHIILDKSSKVLQNWDSSTFNPDKLDYFWETLYIKKNTSPLLWAYDIIDRVTKIGFDWSNSDQILSKVEEEYLEVRESLDRPKDLEEEVGDLLFTVVNLSHYLGYNPEILLRRTSEKFIDRFKKMEEVALGQDRIISELTTEDLEDLWQASKSILKVI